MKLELLFIIITGCIVYNTYNDNNILNYVKQNMKYIKIGGYIFSAFTIYLLFKKNPIKSHNILQHATDIIKYMPIDKNSKDLITPFLDMTNTSNMTSYSSNNTNTHHLNRMMNSGKNIPEYMNNMTNQQVTTMKRSVSETKKKYVASNQNWKCGHCNQQLDHTYEIDHIKDLRYGGNNEVNNLVALCRNCHGKKTLMSKL